jgi:fatty aldehyde-generating acyl-ACP reductase
MESFAFIIHPLEPKADVARKYPRLARIVPTGLIHFLSEFWPPLVLSRVSGVRSAATGKEVEGWLLACPLTARQMVRLPPARAYRKIIQTGRLAERLGARILGLGAFTSVVGDGGVTVARTLTIPVTTGDSYTVAVVLETLLEAGRRLGISPAGATAAVIGASGAIGSASARLLGPQVARLILVGRDENRLRQVAAGVTQADGSPPMVSTTLEAVREADLVLSATSAGRPLLFPEHLKAGAVVCDVARPHDVSPRVARERDDVLVVDGGLVEMPGGVNFRFDYTLPRHLTFACMAETITLALEGRFEDYTLGKDLRTSQIAEIAGLAARHGFRPAPFYSFGRLLSDEEIEAVRRKAAATYGSVR